MPDLLAKLSQLSALKASRTARLQKRLVLTTHIARQALAENEELRRKYAEWDEAAHPRGKSTPESTPGSFIGAERVTENLPDEDTFRDRLWDVQDREHGMIIDKDGKARMILKGKADKITIRDDELNLLKDGRFIHNHPGGSALSPSDFVAAYKANEKSTEAFGVDRITGERIRWIAERPDGGWPDEKRIRRVERSFTDIRVRQAREKIKNKEMGVDEATHWATNAIIFDVVKSVGIKMERRVY